MSSVLLFSYKYKEASTRSRDVCSCSIPIASKALTFLDELFDTVAFQNICNQVSYTRATNFRCRQRIWKAKPKKNFNVL